jgi:hypothetical protein
MEPLYIVFKPELHQIIVLENYVDFFMFLLIEHSACSNILPSRRKNIYGGGRKITQSQKQSIFLEREGT